MAFNRVLAVFVTLVCVSHAFLSSSTLKFDDEAMLDTRDHAIISKVGILKSLVEFLKDNPRYLKEKDPARASELLDVMVAVDNPAGIQKLISAVTSGLRLQNAIAEIQNSNAEMNSKPFSSVAAVHFSGEQFETGITRLLRLKSQIVTSLLNGVKFEHARQLSGQYLHTLQDFYSHSNWIELGNQGATYEVLGKPGVSVSADFFAKPSEPTCIPCSSVSSQKDACDNNLITKKMTSGYFVGQDISKPTNVSKCRHGGVLDSSSLKREARGGINKETKSRQWSPHYKLHDVAAELAIEATKQFFEDIRFIVGDGTFARFLNLQAVRTLALVIDVSGSMGREIRSVRKLSTGFVQGASNSSVNTAFIYILVPFNDPDVGPVTVTSDPDTVIQAVNSLQASEGGDCPEMGMTGLYQALLQSVDDSVIYYFSDADAKDSELAQTVLILAKQKRIKINFILSGKCSYRRKRRDIPSIRNTNGVFEGRATNDGYIIEGYAAREMRQDRRVKRSAPNKPLGTQVLYQSLATATGGQVLRTVKSEVSVLVDIIGSRISNVDNDDLVEVTLLNAVSRSVEAISDVPYLIHVDNTLQDFLIVLSADKNPAITVINPTDSQTLTAAMFTQFKNLQITKLNGFPGGPLLIQVSCTGPYSLQVTGRSTLAVTYSLTSVENRQTGSSRRSVGSPIKGQQLLLNLAFTEPEFVQEVTALSLVHQNGTELESFPIQSGKGINSGSFSLLFTPSAKSFHFKFTGKTSTGKMFQRVKPTEIKLETVELSFIYRPGHEMRTIFPGGTTNISLLINNTGDSQNFTFQAKDDLGFVQGLLPSYGVVPANETAEITLILQAPVHANYGSTSTVTVFALSTPSNTSSSNYLVFYVTVVSEENDNFPPSCEIVNQTGTCDAVYGTRECANITWTSHLSLHDVGQGLLWIAAKSSKHGQLNVAPFKSSSSNQSVSAMYTSTCCQVATSVVVVDQVGSKGVCDLNLVPDLFNLTARSEKSELRLAPGETSEVEFHLTNFGTKGAFTLQTSESIHFISYVSPMSTTLGETRTTRGKVLVTGQRETGSNATILVVRAVSQTNNKADVKNIPLLKLGVIVLERKEADIFIWNLTTDVDRELSLIMKYGDKDAMIEFTVTNNGRTGAFVFKTSPSQLLVSKILPSSLYLNHSEKAYLMLSVTVKQNQHLRETLQVIAVPQSSGKDIKLFQKTVEVSPREESSFPALMSLVPTRKVTIGPGTTVKVNFTIMNLGQDGEFKLWVSSLPSLDCHVTPNFIHLRRNKRVLGYLTVKSSKFAESGRHTVKVTAIVSSAEKKKAETVVFTLHVVVTNKVVETQITEEERKVGMTAIIVIVVGCMLFIALVFLALFLYVRKRRSWNVPKTRVKRDNNEVKIDSSKTDKNGVEPEMV